MNDELRVMNQELKTPNSELPTGHSQLRMVAWELTRSCNLACVHCRASSERGPYPGELTTNECLRVMDEISSFSKPTALPSELERKELLQTSSARWGETWAGE